MEVEDENTSQTNLLQGQTSASASARSSSGQDIRLIYNRLPKLAINVQTQGTSFVTPSPVPKNSLRSHQLQSILEPLNLALLKTSGKQYSSHVKPTHTTSASEVQSRILESLIAQNPVVLSLPDLHLEADGLRDLLRTDCSDVPSPYQVLERTQRNYLKSQLPGKKEESEILNSHREARLNSILENVKKLDASILLKKKAWMVKPRNSSAKDVLRTHLTTQRRLRKQCHPDNKFGHLGKSDTKVSSANSKCQTEVIPEFPLKEESNASTGDNDTSLNETSCQQTSDSDTVAHDNEVDVGSFDNKKPVLTKAQLKEVPRKKLKSRHRLLVLQRKYKIRPGITFKCRRTREKFRFTSVHRTITESGLSLLTAAYALKHGTLQKEPRTSINQSSLVNETMNLPSSIPLTTSLRALAKLGTSVNDFDEKDSAQPLPLEKETVSCHCQQLLAENPRQNHQKPDSPMLLSGRKSSLEHPSMILVNRYTQALPVSNTVEGSGGGTTGDVFRHTIELLAYAREIERKIQTFKTDHVLLDIGKRPQLKPVSRNVFSKNPVFTVPLEKNSLKEALSLGICDFLAHSGFTQATLPVIEVLSEVLESHYEKLATHLKSAAEKEVAGISHGFLDPMDRVTTALGLGGVLGLGNSYKRRVIDYHKTVEQNVDKLENKLATLMMTYKLKGSVESSSNVKLTSNSYAPAYRIVKIEKPTREYQTLPQLLSDNLCSQDSKSSSTVASIDDLSLSLQIDSVPSLSSV